MHPYIYIVGFLFWGGDLFDALKPCTYPGTPFTTEVSIDPLLANALAFQGGALVLLLLVGAATKFVLGKCVAVALIAMYFIFLLLCFLIGFGVIA
jgi:hypothetical protein